MYIEISKNLDSIGCEVEAIHGELGSKKNAERLLSDAYSVAEWVWEKYPQFKTVALDTYSRQELEIIDSSQNKEGGS